MKFSIFDADTLRFINANKGAQNNIGFNLDELINLTPVDIKTRIYRSTI